MKIFIILLLSIFVLWNPFQGPLYASEPMVHPLDLAEKELEKITLNSQNPLRDVNQNLKNYSDLLGLFEKFKIYDVNLTNGLLDKVKNGDPLSGTELFNLRRTLTIYYKINKKILDFAKVYDFGGFKMSRTFAKNNRNTPLIKAHLIWLSGHLLVLDHLETMHSILYEENEVFRRIVKNSLIDKDSGPDTTNKTLNDIIKVNQYTVEIGESSKFNEQINLVSGIETDIREILKSEPSAQSLINAIVTNKTASDIIRGKRKFAVRNFTFEDSLVTNTDTVTGWLSRIFGNIAGAIKWRNGFLYENDDALKRAKENLRPFDVIIEKSPFVLTDKFIPGHYGHVAVYLGTKKQLEEIGMWGHPSIIPYQEEIESGKVILEAVRSGVRLNSIEEFLNIDELTIMRKDDGLANPELMFEEITRGMDQIGKEYDFNFDISTLDKIVCSELIYIFYGNVHWPTHYRVGRATITPDDVAEILFHKNTKFSLVNFMVAKHSRSIDQVGLDYIADEFDYELRTMDGDPLPVVENNANQLISFQKNETNSYWKKETKCYSVAESSDGDFPTDGAQSETKIKRVCKTTYKENIYEERNPL